MLSKRKTVLGGVVVECGCHWSFSLASPSWAQTDHSTPWTVVLGKMTITSSWTCFVSAFISLGKNCHTSMEMGFSWHHLNLLFHTPFTVSLSSSPLKHTAVIVMANPECESRFHFPFPLFIAFFLQLFLLTFQQFQLFTKPLPTNHQHFFSTVL